MASSSRSSRGRRSGRIGNNENEGSLLTVGSVCCCNHAPSGCDSSRLRRCDECELNYSHRDCIVNGVSQSPSNIQNFRLRYYQKDAIEHLLRADEARMQCIMPCGTGKTFMFLHYVLRCIEASDHGLKVLFLLPSLQLINQLYQSFMEFFAGKIKIKDTLCICSQMDSITLIQDEDANDANANEILYDFLEISKDVPYTTDPNKIRQVFSRFAAHKRDDDDAVLCVFSTYQSSDLLEGKQFDVSIYDEAHKTTSICFRKTLKDDFTALDRRIFFTATPKHVKYTKKKKKTDEEVISMNDAALYGRVEYEYMFKTAIADKFILDYQLVFCYCHDRVRQSADYAQLLQEKFIGADNLGDVDANMLLSALMLAKSIQSKQRRIGKMSKVLTYHNTIKNAEKFAKLLKYALPKCGVHQSCDIFAISGEMKISKRKQIFENFKRAEIGIICSSRVLNEGVDLPFVDTIMFVEPRRSTIDIVQCIGRGLRLHKDLEKCIVLLPIYYDSMTSSYSFDCVLEILMAMIEDRSLIQLFIPKSKKNDAEDTDRHINVEDGDDCDDDEEFGKDERIQIIEFSFDEHGQQENESEAKQSLDNELDDAINKDVFKELRLKILQSQQINFEYQRELLFEWIEKQGRCPTQREKPYKGKHIGRFLDNAMKQIGKSDTPQQDWRYTKLSTNDLIKQKLDTYLSDKQKPKMSADEKQQLLFEWCDANETAPKPRQKYKRVAIGRWLMHQKSKIVSDQHALYTKLAANKYVKKDLDRNLKIKRNEREKAFYKYVNEMKECPSDQREYEGQKIGMWWRNMKTKIHSKHDKRYKKFASDPIVKQALDEYLVKKTENKKKKKLKFDQWKQLLFEWSDQHGTHPPAGTKHHGHNIGNFLNNQKIKITAGDDEIYVKLSENPHIKKELDRYLLDQKRPKQKRLSFAESKQLMFEYCNEQGKVPTTKTMHKNRNIGKWFSHQKEKIKSNTDDRYLELSENQHAKKALDQYLMNKNQPKLKRLSFAESNKLLFEYCNENGKVPTGKTMHKNHNIGNWFGHQKTKIESKTEALYLELSENERKSNKRKKIDEATDNENGEQPPRKKQKQ